MSKKVGLHVTALVVESRGNEKQAMARGWPPQRTRKAMVPESREWQIRTMSQGTAVPISSLEMK